MKKNRLPALLFTAAILWINVTPLTAQQHPFEGNVTVEPVQLKQSGDTLLIDFNLILNDFKIKSVEGVDFIPVLTTSDRNLVLPEISLKGTNEYQAYRRKLRSMSKIQKQEYKAPYVVEKGKRAINKTFSYRYNIPYQQWMNNASVEIRYNDCGCGETEFIYAEQLGSVTPTPPAKVIYKPVPHLAYVQPTAETVKRREIKVESFLDFIVNKTEIRPDYMNNPRELGKIQQMLDELKADPTLSIKQIDIIGYASPEGSLANNKRLSEGRAKALRDYLAKQYDFPQSIYQTVFGGENWNGLLAALDTIDIAYKQEVINIIENYEVDKGRKNRIMNLRAGQPYRFMLKNVYPSLRVAVCKVNYDIRNFTIDEAKEMIKTRPQNLSLNEMFLVANTYTEGSPEFNQVFETALKVFPNDEAAHLNAACSAISRNDPATAKSYMRKVTPQTYPAEYNNMMGILTLLKKDYEVAEEYFKAAAAKGLKAAGLNLQEVEKAK